MKVRVFSLIGENDDKEVIEKMIDILRHIGEEEAYCLSDEYEREYDEYMGSEDVMRFLQFLYDKME